MVPAYAKIKYEVRAGNVTELKELFARVRRCAEGAALMTETEMSCELTMAFSDFRQNSVLASIVSGCLAELGAPEWTKADYVLAKKFLSSYDAHTREEVRRDLEQPVAVEAAKRECRARSGGHYSCPLPDFVKPPIGRY